METFQRFLLVSAIVLFIIVFYKWLMKYLRRRDINDPFPYLFPFEKDVLSGQEVLKFDMPYKSQVRAEVYSTDEQKLFTAFDQEIEKGVHQMAFDVSSLPSGTYELKVSFPNQTLRRPIKISNAV
ncbi:MAG TPA: hypothetical protein VJ949_06920 [Cryomorphaceae bacterium]|nr:hypothetical protein [Cryomorphaceae bacterium]